MNAIVPLFLLAPLVVVPLGYRLLEVVSPRARPPSSLSAALVPAAVLLAVSFLLTPGAAAGLLATPWFVVTGAVAVVAVDRRMRDRDRWRVELGLAVDGAVLFLAIGAIWAVLSRLGVQPMGFDPTIVLLTAVHFHYAGFALVLVGSLTYQVARSRRLALALIALLVGIPLTALGFLGVAGANLVGALMTALAGFAIGVSLLQGVAGFPTRVSRGLGVVAGATLLVSMPLAVAYATALAAGISGPSVELMVRVHGSLNVIGFAVPAIAALSIASRATASSDRGEIGRDVLAAPSGRTS